jgi:hypothetical protein
MRRMRVVGVIAKEELEQRREEEVATAARAASGEDEPKEPADELDGEHAESAETELIEANDVETDAEAESDDIEDAVEATEVLESIRLVLESRKDKGLSPAEAQLANIGLTAAYKLAGFTEVSVYSPESYTDAKRVHVTRLSMEDIEKQTTDVWAKIKEAIIRFWEQVKEWFGKVREAVKRYFDRAQQVMAAAEKIDGVPKNAELQKPNLAKALHIGGNVDTGRALTVLEGATKAVLEDQKAVIGMAKAAAGSNATGIDQAVTAVLGKIGKGVGNPKAEGFDKQFVSRSDELPGGFAIVAAWNNMSDVKIGISPFKPSAPEFEGKSVKTLTKEEIIAVAKGILSLQGELKQLDSELDAAANEAKTLTAAIDSLYKAGESKPEDKEKVKTLTKLAQAVLAEPGRSFSGYAARTIKSLLDVAELSVREYSGNEKQSANSQLPAPAAPAAGGAAE